MQSCGMRQENEVLTENIMKCYCGCVGLQNKIQNVSRIFFCPSLLAKSQKKLNLPKRLLAKLQPFIVEVAVIVLTQQICILELPNQVLKLVCFKDLEKKLEISIKCKIYVNT